MDQVRVEFRRDSIDFYSTFDVQKYNFRQSLSRIIHWDRAREKTDTVIVPITLKLPDGEINAATGDASLRHKVFLIAYKKSGSGYTYKMLTYIGDAIVSLKEFSGTVYYEDYFEGRVKYKTYDRGYPLDTRHDRLSPYDRVASVKDGLVGYGMDCDWTKVATVCVGDPQNEDAPFVCTDRYEYQCSWDRDSFPDIEDEVDESDSGEAGGGGGGSSSNQNKGLKDDKLSNEDKKKLKETIDDAKKQNCAYKALLEAMGKNGSISFVVDANRNVGGGGGTYFVNTKEIVYAGSFALGHVGLLTHEAFHAYQHQVVYGSGFGNYSSGKAGNINMEFEQIVFQDISIRASGSNYGVGEMFRQDTKPGFDVTKKAYMDWINMLTNNGTTYPNLQSYPNFDAEFSKHLNSFKQYGHPGYANTSEILNNLKPNALKKLFDGTLNCNN